MVSVAKSNSSTVEVSSSRCRSALPHAGRLGATCGPAARSFRRRRQQTIPSSSSCQWTAT